nr:hypothetical protein [Kibdelosporangium sp. MJ126-NF4]CTQ94888.1 hypothetical protein [Kibdelosporangium sp. MJ126-NF4]
MTLARQVSGAMGAPDLVAIDRDNYSAFTEPGDSSDYDI